LRPRALSGKSGGFRVCYVDFTEFGFIFLVAIDTHDEKGNLCAAEKRAAAAFIDTARKGFKQRNTR
jgi:hypothetical protein